MKRMHLLLVFFLISCMAVVSRAAISTGSGCAIRSDLILTAYHVVSGADIIEVSFGGGKLIPATLDRFDETNDWAILKTSIPLAHVVVVPNSREQALGDKVYTLGFPSVELLGSSVKYSEGTISALSGGRGNRQNFQISVPIQPGNSGGPLFDARGHLVGIVLKTLRPDTFYKITDGSLPQNVNFALRVSEISNLPSSKQHAKDVSVSENELATCFIRAESADKKKQCSDEKEGSATLSKPTPDGVKEKFPCAVGDVKIDSLGGIRIGSYWKREQTPTRGLDYRMIMWKWADDYVIGGKSYKARHGFRDGEWDSITIEPNPQILNFENCQVFHAVPPKKDISYTSATEERMDDSGRVDKIRMEAYCDDAIANSLVGMFMEKYKINFEFEATPNDRGERYSRISYGGEVVYAWRYRDSKGRLLEVREDIYYVGGYRHNNRIKVVLSLTDEKAFKDGAIRAAKRTIDSL